jgi:hypothetical protein
MLDSEGAAEAKEADYPDYDIPAHAPEYLRHGLAFVLLIGLGAEYTQTLPLARHRKQLEIFRHVGIIPYRDTKYEMRGVRK